MGGTCRLMKELIEIDGVKNLPYESIERIKSIICGTHNGVCSERFSGIKESTGLFPNEKQKWKEKSGMNYPSDKNKEQKTKLYYGHRYLVYDIGHGEQGAEERYSIYRYYICIGYSEDEVVEDWIRQSPFKKEDVKRINGR